MVQMTTEVETVAVMEIAEAFQQAKKAGKGPETFHSFLTCNW